MIRGSGIQWDIRKNFPYSIYSDTNLMIPIGINGDCYDRYFIRVQEMRQSVKMCNHCLRVIRKGEILAKDNKITFPSRSNMK